MILGSALYRNVHPFNNFDIFKGFREVTNPEDLKGVDALVVWGGADIHPSLYNDVNSHSHVYGEEPSKRDALEWALMQEAIVKGIPIIGVCRGGQMLCAAAGGKLYQHVDNHASGSHNAVCDDGTTLSVSSLHHQMMNPFGTDHKLVMWSEHNRSLRYLDPHGEHTACTTEVEPEYIYFPKIRGHALQWHPEFHGRMEPCNIWLNDRWKNEF